MKGRAPADGHVHIWIARVDDCFDRVPEDEWLASLPEEDHARCLRARVASVRRERIITRVLIRQGLSYFSGRAPSSWRFTQNKLGRPEAVDAEGLRFNASHSHGLVVFAFTHEREVGIDTESFLRSVPDRAEFGRFLSPTESRQLSETPEDDYARTFFRFWTLKEAYAKARGVGISIGFDKFSVELKSGEDRGPESHPLLLDDRTSSRWHLREFFVPTHHLVALALERKTDGEDPVVQLHAVSLCRNEGGLLEPDVMGATM